MYGTRSSSALKQGGGSYYTKSGSAGYRVLANANNSINAGIEIQEMVSGSWQTLASFKQGALPSINFGGIGLRQVGYGATDSGGTGYRHIVVDN